jgi:molybdopterin molybdotransferase
MTPSPLLPFDEALARLLGQAQPVDGHETIPIMAAHGRVLARGLRSSIDVPRADNTQMDGYAVRVAEATMGARLPVSQRIPAGHVGGPLALGTAARIFTGGLIPGGADAVVMQEMADADGDAVIIREAPAPGQWIRRAGEDIREGAEILRAGERLRPQAVGLAASVGLAEVSVHRRVRVACFFTGDELADPGEPLAPGAIYNSNRYVLVGLLRALGCEVSDLGNVPDSLDATRAALRAAAAGNDLIVTSGGVSVGDEDHIRPALEAEGELSLWQIAIKPGKPLAYGKVRDATAREAHFIGLPGNPVSSFVTFLLFVRPFLLRLQGVERVAPTVLPMRADFDWPRPDRRREFLRVRINPEGGLELFPNQGSGVLTSTAWADGLVDNPPGGQVRRGDMVRFLPLDSLLA